MIVAHTEAEPLLGDRGAPARRHRRAGRHRARHRPALPRRPRSRSKRAGAPRRCSGSTRRRARCSRSSLDYPESFERLGRLCVPFLADLCMIDVAEEHGVRRLAAVHADPEKARARRGARDAVPARPVRRAPGRERAARRPARGRRQRCPTSSCRSTTRDERHFEIVTDLDFTLVHVRAARGPRPRARRADARVLGIGPAVRRGRPRAGRGVRAPRRVGARQRAVCTPSAITSPGRCSRACCRRRCPTIPGARVTARYRAAGEGNEVGGDFYHVFQVDETLVVVRRSAT